MKSKLKDLKYSNKLIISLLLILIVGISGYSYYNFQKHENELNQLSKEIKEITSSNSQIQKYKDKILKLSDIELCPDEKPLPSDQPYPDEVFQYQDGRVFVLEYDTEKFQEEPYVKLCKYSIIPKPNETFSSSGKNMEALSYSWHTRHLEVNDPATHLQGIYNIKTSELLFPTLPKLKALNQDSSFYWSSTFYSDGTYGYLLITPYIYGGCFGPLENEQEEVCKELNANIKYIHTQNATYIFRSDGKTVKLFNYESKSSRGLELNFEYDGVNPEYIFVYDGDTLLKKYETTKLFK